MDSKSVEGYVHNVSPTMKSRRGSVPYFNFLLQTAKASYRRAVCYDEKLQKQLEDYQTSRTAAKLRNVGEKRSLVDAEALDLVVTKRTGLQQASNAEIDFEYLERAEDLPMTIVEIQKVEGGQLVIAEGRLTCSSDQIKEIVINGNSIACNESAILTDQTGSIPLTIWGELNKTLTSETSYKLAPLRVKSYDIKRVSTTPYTRVLKLEKEFPPAEEEFAGAADITEIRVPSVNFAEDFKRWFSCGRCSKALTDIATLEVVTCDSCKASQRIAKCAQECNLRITVQDEDNTKHVLTALREVLNAMVAKSNDLKQEEEAISLENTSPEEIYKAFLLLPELIVKFRKSTAVITEVRFD